MSREDGWEDAVIIIDGKPLGHPPKRKGGRKAYDVWAPMFEHLDSIVATTGKKFPYYSTAARTGLDWLIAQQAKRSRDKVGAAVPTYDTIREKIAALRPDLVAEN